MALIKMYLIFFLIQIKLPSQKIAWGKHYILLYILSDYLDNDGDEPKDDLSIDGSEAMDIGDVELKAEASILTKEVKDVLVLIMLFCGIKSGLRVLVFFFHSGLSATKGGRNDRRRKSSPKG